MKYKLWRCIIIPLFNKSTSLSKDPKLPSVLGSRCSLKGVSGAVLSVLRPVQDRGNKGVGEVLSRVLGPKLERPTCGGRAAQTAATQPQQQLGLVAPALPTLFG